ncbi:MAG: helix-turn-helix domain-containing protein [Anaerovoracaceae bacterium]
MDVINRIDALMKERNWSDYRLSLESGLSTSTIANIHRRNTVPSIPTLEAICMAFGISLSQFFAEDESFSMVYLSEEQKKMFDDWLSLTAQQKDILSDIITEFKKTDA